MKSFVLLACAIGAFAQSSGGASSASGSASAAAPSGSGSPLVALASALNQVGAGALATTVAGNPQLVQAFSGFISSGQQFTLLAPSDAGLQAALSTVNATNTTLVQRILQYHLVQGTLTNDSLPLNQASVQNTSIGVPLVFNRTASAIELAPIQNARVTANTSAAGLTIFGINNALRLPTNATSTWAYVEPNSPILQAAAAVPGLADTLNNSTLTVFAPTTAAAGAVQATLAQLAGNATALQSVIGAHVIPGRNVFSTDLASAGDVTSLSGTQLSFTQNATGAFVSGNGGSAAIVLPNVVAVNGNGAIVVLHFINSVLAQGATPAGAAPTLPSSTQMQASMTQSAGGGGGSGGSSTSRSGAASIVVSVLGLVGAGFAAVLMV